jgi:hypothetical protein
MVPLITVTVCGKPLSPEDRKVWRQAIAMLMGLKLRNGLGKKGLTAAVGTALLREAGKRICEDCGVTVVGGATFEPRLPGRGSRSLGPGPAHLIPSSAWSTPLGWQSLNSPPAPNMYRIPCKVQARSCYVLIWSMQ